MVAVEGGVPVDRVVGKGKAFWEVGVWFCEEKSGKIVIVNLKEKM